MTILFLPSWKNSWPIILLIFQSTIQVNAGDKRKGVTILDVESDLHTNPVSEWNVDGDFIYVKNGLTFRHHLQNELPPQLNVTSLYKLNGIWCLFPDIPSHKNSALSKITTQFQSDSFRMVDSISMSYIVGGGAQIYVKGQVGGPNIFTIHPTGQRRAYRLVQVQFTIGPTHQFVVEGEVWHEGDFILIDRILANYVQHEQETPAVHEKEMSEVTHNHMDHHVVVPTTMGAAVALSRGNRFVNCNLGLLLQVVLLVFLITTN